MYYHEHDLENPMNPFSAPPAKPEPEHFIPLENVEIMEIIKKVYGDEE